MAIETHERTIDWTDYWRGADEEDREGASPNAKLVVEPLREFLAEIGAPNSYADVGCGAGAVSFEVAERYPDATVVGYDAAKPILDENRRRASEDDVENVGFEHTVLPDFHPDRRFDVVSCFYTICYVADIDRALGNLYDAVTPGGSLVFSYHNRYARAVFRKIADAPEEHLGESSPWKPERFEDRFELLLEDESVLSYERIHDVLGTWPQSVWSVAENTERYPAWRHNPLVYVPKPRDDEHRQS